MRWKAPTQNKHWYIFHLHSRFSISSTALNMMHLCLITAYETREHSSRMHTARLLTVSHGIPCISGGGLPNLSPIGRPPSSQTRSLMDRITDTCKNITLSQTQFAGGKCNRRTKQNDGNHSPVFYYINSCFIIFFSYSIKHRKFHTPDHLVPCRGKFIRSTVRITFGPCKLGTALPLLIENFHFRDIILRAVNNKNNYEWYHVNVKHGN